MQLINIGYGNMVSASRVIAIVAPDSAPIKRLIQESRDKGTLIDATYGRKTRAVVIMDSDGKPLWFIDVKISDKYLGAVSLGSLVNFNENGIYVCINKSTKDYRIFSHRDLVEIVKADRSLLKEPTKTYKGYPVEWEGENLTSEWYVKGNDIKNFER